MFGGNNSTVQPTDNSATTPPAGTTLPQVEAPTSGTPSYDSNGFLTTDPTAAGTPTTTAPSLPAVEPTTLTAAPSVADVPGPPQLDTTAPAAVTPAVDTTPAASGAADDLLDIKQQALQQLSPLVGHLDQTPEEKFRTTMMMIQAADDQSLIHQAYDAAQAIPDEKTKAQALLDIVNEINYFTQSHEQ